MKNISSMACILLAVSMTAGMVTGCMGSGQEPAKSDSSKEQAANEKVTLRFAWWGGEERHKATLEAIAKYEEINPHIKIEAEYSGYDGYQQKLITQLSGGNAADIVQVDKPWLPDLANQGDLLLDLSQEKVIDLSVFDQEFLENNMIIDGKLLGVPTGINANVMLYNKEFTDKFALDMNETWSWDQFMDLGESIHRDYPERYLMSIDMGIASQMMLWYLQQKTGEYWISEGYTMLYTREDWVDALTMFRGWIDKGVIEPLEVSSLYEGKTSENPNWLNANLGMFPSWVSNISSVNVDGTLDIRVSPVPCIVGAAGTGIDLRPSQLFSVPASSKHKHESVQFLNWLLNDEEAITILKDVRGVPASTKAREFLVEKQLMPKENDDAITKSIELGGMNVPNIPAGETNEVLKEVLQEVGFGASSPEEAADKLMSEYSNMLAELKANQ